MTVQWDEFTKSLVEESVSRRDSLRRLGFALVGTMFGSLGATTAWAARRSSRTADPCKTFCKCRNKQQQDQCLKACNACGKNPKRMGGRCGSYFCCAVGQTPCGSSCADLANDFDNCGACGYACDEPGAYEYGVCINGRCEYDCAEGAEYCYGICTFLDSDPDNCGACGNVCPASAPVCREGACVCPSGMTVCDGECLDLGNDPANCGACGKACPASAPYCRAGVCAAEQCPPGLTFCDPGCVDLSSDPYNCGACYNQCAPSEACAGGVCQGICVGC